VIRSILGAAYARCWVTPHVAQNTGEAVGLCRRNRIAEASGWLETVAGRDKTRF
jgi:hypothetical protein